MAKHLGGRYGIDIMDDNFDLAMRAFDDNRELIQSTWLDAMFGSLGSTTENDEEKRLQDYMEFFVVEDCLVTALHDEVWCALQLFANTPTADVATSEKSTMLGSLWASTCGKAVIARHAKKGMQAIADTSVANDLVDIVGEVAKLKVGECFSS